MKRTLVVFIALFTVTYQVGARPTAGALPRLTPEQREMRKYRHFGGYVIQSVETKVISIVDGEGFLDGGTLGRIVTEMQALLSLPVCVGVSEGTGVTITICAGDGATTLAVFPENARARIDIKALSADNPTKETLEIRVHKELWRGLVYVLGGGNTYHPQCVMKQISSLGELDTLRAKTACPDVFARILEGAASLGIRPVRRVTYRQAVREGWAPAPTNYVQRAIWDEVKKTPPAPPRGGRGQVEEGGAAEPREGRPPPSYEDGAGRLKKEVLQGHVKGDSR
ncbi:MAG: hypothetical protein J6334_08035 [Kiritimatiellae bacterium]|nr:hypothetical protein [Kiritimatiellia bacterium]